MEITGLISALVFGLVIGGLGRLVVPGKQHISMVMTILVGIAAALLGTFAASVFGVSDTPGFDWVEMALQVGLAGIGVTTLARSKSRQYR